jgi:hypothetical protein
MSRILDSKLTLRRVLVLGSLIATLATSAGALAINSINGQFGAGSIRMSSASTGVFVSISGSDPVTKVLSTSISVPSGKTADVQASFSVTVTHNNGSFAYCFGAFTIDGSTNDSLFHPGHVQLLGGATTTEPDQVSVGMTGWRKNIGPGTHHVNVYVDGAFAGCTLQDRNLNVLVNIH